VFKQNQKFLLAIKSVAIIESITQCQGAETQTVAGENGTAEETVGTPECREVPGEVVGLEDAVYCRYCGMLLSVWGWKEGGRCGWWEIGVKYLEERRCGIKGIKERGCHTI
jgi:hypothetical protein